MIVRGDDRRERRVHIGDNCVLDPVDRKMSKLTVGSIRHSGNGVVQRYFLEVVEIG